VKEKGEEEGIQKLSKGFATDYSDSWKMVTKLF
jgi:hypothetical protein